MGAAALAGCASSPPQPDPVQVKLNDLDVRLTRVERVVDNGSLLQLANQLEATRADLRAMHDSLDQMQHRLDEDRRRERDLYADLDARLKTLEAPGAGVGNAVSPESPGSAGGGTSSGPAVAAAGPDDVLPPASSQSSASRQQGQAIAGAASASASSAARGSAAGAYQAAFDLLRNSHYAEAAAAFKRFLVEYPDSSYADNAQYWLAETYYVNREFPAALQAFQAVADRYGQSRKLPDALLKVGYCDDQLHRPQEARRVLRDLVARFPGTPAARLAVQRLDKMKTETH